MKHDLLTSRNRHYWLNHRAVQNWSLPVRQCDIDNGVPGCPNNCMDALAVEREFYELTGVEAQRVSVYKGEVRLTPKGQRKGCAQVRLVWKVSDAEQHRQAEFDENRNATPHRLYLSNLSVIASDWRSQRSRTATRKGVKYRKTGKTAPRPKRSRVEQYILDARAAAKRTKARRAA